MASAAVCAVVLLGSVSVGYTPYAAIEVQALAGMYIFVPEIARRSEMHFRRAATWLRSTGIRPEIAVQENRDLGYLRLAIEPLLVELTGETAQVKASLESAGDTVRAELIAAGAAGAGAKATVAAMGVPYREAKRWVEVWRETGAVAPRKFGYRSRLEGHEDFLRQLVGERPNIKLAEIREALGQRGVKTSKTSIWNALTRFGLGLADRDARHATRRPAPPPTPRIEERNSR